MSSILTKSVILLCSNSLRICVNILAMKNKKILISTLLVLLIVGFFFLGMSFKEIKNSILKIFKSNENISQVEQEKIKTSSEYVILELGNTSFKNAILHNMDFNTENRDFIRDLTFTFTINNNSLQSGIKTVALISCQYTYNGMDKLYLKGSGIGNVLEKAILINELGDVTVHSDRFFSYGICSYDSNGYRKCVDNHEENEITIDSCILGYSSNPEASNIGDIAWHTRETLNDEGNLNLNFSDSYTIDNDTDILEKVGINKTINVNNLGRNQ
jgi:hypothetical protein